MATKQKLPNISKLVPANLNKDAHKVLKSRTMHTVIALGVYALTVRLQKYLPHDFAVVLAQSIMSDVITTVVWLFGIARIAWLKFDDHYKVTQLLEDKEKQHDD